MLATRSTPTPRCGTPPVVASAGSDLGTETAALGCAPAATAPSAAVPSLVQYAHVRHLQNLQWLVARPELQKSAQVLNPKSPRSPDRQTGPFSVWPATAATARSKGAARRIPVQQGVKMGRDLEWRC